MSQPDPTGDTRVLGYRLLDRLASIRAERRGVAPGFDHLRDLIGRTDGGDLVTIVDRIGSLVECEGSWLAEERS